MAWLTWVSTFERSKVQPRWFHSIDTLVRPAAVLDATVK